MVTVGVAELKAKLSEYLARVRAGEEVVVTDRGRPIARIGPAHAVEDEHLAELERAGLVKIGTGVTDEFLNAPRPGDPDAGCARGPLRGAAGGSLRCASGTRRPSSRLSCPSAGPRLSSSSWGRTAGSPVWWGTRVECASALRRRERAGVDIGDGIRLLGELAPRVGGASSQRADQDDGRALLAVHPLRAADALQLAAAIAWRRDPTRRAGFVCFDERLRDAAAREGFELAPETV